MVAEAVLLGCMVKNAKYIIRIETLKNLQKHVRSN